VVRLALSVDVVLPGATVPSLPGILTMDGRAKLDPSTTNEKPGTWPGSSKL
jgi:hypothetical protein